MLGETGTLSYCDWRVGGITGNRCVSWWQGLPADLPAASCSHSYFHSDFPIYLNQILRDSVRSGTIAPKEKQKLERGVDLRGGPQTGTC